MSIAPRLPFRDPSYEADLSALALVLERHHAGREQAITISTLARQWRCSKHEMQEMIAALVTERRSPVGTCNRGVYWIANEEDRRLAGNYLYPRAVKILWRYRILMRVSADELAEQLKLEMK